MKCFFKNSLFALALSFLALNAHASVVNGPGSDINPNEQPNPAVLGQWQFSTVASDIGAQVTLDIHPDYIDYTAVCTYPAYLPVYATTTRLRVRARVGQDSIWMGKGSASTSSGTLNCPIQSAGGTGKFQIIGKTMRFVDQNDQPEYASNGVEVVLQRLGN